MQSAQQKLVSPLINILFSKSDSRLRNDPFDNTPHSKERSSAAEMRYNRRYQSPTVIDDPRFNRRDPLPFRRMISNDYRQYRSAVNDARTPTRYSSFEESKNRRPQSNSYDYKSNKYRKISSDKRPVSSKNLYGLEHMDRIRSMSREKLNRYNQIGTGNPNRIPTYGRITTRPSEAPKKKGRLGT